MATLRAQQTVAVRNPDVPGQMLVIKEHDPYDEKDPLVRAYPWAFGSDVEQATASPGEKRTTVRR